MEYPEIAQLIQLQKDFNLRVESAAPGKDISFIPVRFFAGEQCWKIYIDNEYRYFNTYKPLVCIYLVLRALEDYKAADDYLEWCQDNELNASETKWLTYYNALGVIYNEIEKVLHTIDAFITPFDYELRAGAFAALLNHNGQ